MDRRQFLGRLDAGAALASFFLSHDRLRAALSQLPQDPSRGESALKITRVRAILTAPQGARLIGGKCRVAAPLYGRAGGTTGSEAVDSVRRYLERGYRYVPVQVCIPQERMGPQRRRRRRTHHRGPWQPSPDLRRRRVARRFRT